MTDPASVDLLAAYLRGDQEAAAVLFARYAERLLALARGQMSQRLAQKVGPEDVVQSAYGSFFHRARAGQFTLRQSGDLWNLLVAITVNKVRRQVERFHAGKRALDREEGLPDDLAVLAREPSPEDAALLADELEQLFHHLPARHRRIVELRLQGRSVAEIADETHYTETRVRQVLAQVEGRQREREQATRPAGG
jgi:RNA polymerase sigma-70 factor (ECF subfamily)